MSRRWWQGYLALGAAATGVHYLLRPPLQHLVYVAVDAAMVAALLLGVRLHRPAWPRPWLLLAAGQGAYLAGDAWYTLVNQDLLHVHPFPSGADACYLASYPLTAFGLLLLARRRAAADRAGLLDALMVATAAGVLSWTYLLAPQARGLGGEPLAARLVAMAYPLGDLVLLTVSARLAIGPGRRPPAFQLLGAGLLLLLGTDVAYAGAELTGSFSPGSWLYLGWMLSFVLRGAAALHPSMVSLTERAPAVAPHLSRARLALLATAALTVPAVDAVQDLRSGAVAVPVIPLAIMVLFLLALARLFELATGFGAHSERQRLLDRVLRAAEEERVRVASELHDGPIQQLAALGHTAERVGRRMAAGDQAEAATLLHQLREALTEQVSDLRRVMSELRPPVLDERGLAVALRDHVEAFTRKHDVASSVEIRLSGRLDPSVETILYRAAQESLVNVVKHARAGRVSVVLAESADTVDLQVRDDGVGFEPDMAARLPWTGHFGLASMRERVALAGGRCDVRSRPGRGTTVRVALPRSHPT